MNHKHYFPACSAYSKSCARRWRAVAFLGATALSFAGVPAVHAQRLDRNNLLIYRDDQGKAAPVRSIRDWQVRRAEILAGAQKVMGPLPGPSKRVSLDVKVDEEVDCGSYVRRAITYLAEPGSRVPAYLLIPKAGGCPVDS